MKILQTLLKTVSIFTVMMFWSCSDQFAELNENPNGVAPANGNPNLILPTVQSGFAMEYLNLGYGNLAGVIQHLQKDSHFDGFNHYNWGQQDWGVLYGLLRNNRLLYQQAVDRDLKFHQGVALTMEALMFATITDLWGDAPYTNAIKGAESASFLTPEFDSQELIYKGVIEDLKAAASLFATGDNTGYLSGYDVFYDGNTEMWHKFANTLILRYAMRVSDKLPDLARSSVESVYSSGINIQNASEDATMYLPGNSSESSWPKAVAFAQESEWRRIKPCQTLLDKLLEHNDPRLQVWFQPVHVQWVADPFLPNAVDEFIREDGEILTGVKSYTNSEFQVKIHEEGHQYTRHYNPDLYTSTPPFTIGPINDKAYVGLPPGLLNPSYYNENPTTGQTVENQHVSQLSNMYKENNGEFLKARLASAAETSFILAEAALKGWSAGEAESHYNAGVQNSLNTWGVGDQYSSYIMEEGVAYNGTLEQIIEQKWIAAWTASAEAWFDFRRTGFPVLQPGPASPQPVLPVRFIYGENETFNNTEHVEDAISRLEETPYSGPGGKNSQWSKSWIIQGTSEPW